MKSIKDLMLLKRDGTAEAFNFVKLRSCLARLLAAAHEDPELAEPLVRAIAMHLREWSAAQLPTTEYVLRCARAVLRQTGMCESARLLETQHRLRQARRSRVRVTDPRGPATAPVRWRKGAVVATLQRLYGVRQPIARFLAGRIEGRVLELGYPLVSRPFLTELVRNEMLAWGLEPDVKDVLPTPSLSGEAGPGKE